MRQPKALYPCPSQAKRLLKGHLELGHWKVITAEAKDALNLPSWVREIDICCLRGHRSTLKPIKDHTRDQISLLFRLKKAQTMPHHCSKRAETSKKPRRDHQKGKHNRNCCNYGPRSSRPQGSIPATWINTTKTLAQNNCGRDQLARWENKDMSRTICYNCNKKTHFANQCPEPRKPKNLYWSWRLPRWWLVLVGRLQK